MRSKPRKPRGLKTLTRPPIQRRAKKPTLRSTSESLGLITDDSGTGAGSSIRPPDPHWIGPEPEQDETSQRLATALRLPEALCRLLVARGHGNAADAKRFLRPLVEHFHPPQLLADSAVATRRIAQAIRDGESILVHGDYDVDGIAGTALLTRFIRELGGTVEGFVPHRIKDGYDFGEAGIEAARRVSASLLVTVDCGISAFDPIRRAVEAGLDVVVTDHHAPPERLPPALAVVNPNRPDCSYPNKGLSGTGVAFKVCCLLAEEFSLPLEEMLPRLDLVALATVADLVPLTGENRALVRFGVRAFEQTSLPGLRALVRSTGLEGERIDAGRLGWVIGPRINAAGRVGDSDTALRLLLSDDPAECTRLAATLEDANTDRREVDQSVLDEALRALPSHFDPDTHHSVVLASDGWHPGVIGIVASRIVERVHRPVVLIALDGDSGRGSARSIPGFNLHGALESCSADLRRFGGHAGAAGMDIDRDRVESFRTAFEEVARSALAGRDLRPELKIDIALDPKEATMEFVELLRHLGPFGMGNRNPVFVSRGVELAGSAREVGRGHLKLGFRSEGRTVDAIGFGLARRRPPDTVREGLWDVAYQLEENRYRGRSTVQAKLLDLVPATGFPQDSAPASGTH